MTLSPNDRMELTSFVTGSGRWIRGHAETAADMAAIHREVLVLLVRAVLQLDRSVEDLAQRLDRVEARLKAAAPRAS